MAPLCNLLHGCPPGLRGPEKAAADAPPSMQGKTTGASLADLWIRRCGLPTRVLQTGTRLRPLLRLRAGELLLEQQVVVHHIPRAGRHRDLDVAPLVHPRLERPHARAVQPRSLEETAHAVLVSLWLGFMRR